MTHSSTTTLFDSPIVCFVNFNEWSKTVEFLRLMSEWIFLLLSTGVCKWKSRTNYLKKLMRSTLLNHANHRQFKNLNLCYQKLATFFYLSWSIKNAWLIVTRKIKFSDWSNVFIDNVARKKIHKFFLIRTFFLLSFNGE